MINATSIRDREVININDGRKLGIVSDVEIDFGQGKIISIVIPGPGKLMGLFGKDNDIVIPWKNIKKVGIDVILVDIDDNNKNEEKEE
jgi:YlmC/YmxH family sporulation protein